MLQLSPGRKLLIAFVIAFSVTTVPIVHFDPASLPSATQVKQQANSGADTPAASLPALAQGER